MTSNLKIDGDLLSAASLTLGVLGALFALWTPEINRALDLEKPRHEADRKPNLAKVTSARSTRAIPLFGVTFATWLILTPSAVYVVVDAVHTFAKHNWSAFKLYDPAEGLFIMVWVLLLVLSIATGAKLWALRNRIRDFKKPA